ncbi:MAG: hypothetical protein U0638_16715 [Phycisphaerales bacterium]
MEIAAHIVGRITVLATLRAERQPNLLDMPGYMPSFLCGLIACDAINQATFLGEFELVSLLFVAHAFDPASAHGLPASEIGARMAEWHVEGIVLQNTVVHPDFGACPSLQAGSKIMRFVEQPFDSMVDEFAEVMSRTDDWLKSQSANPKFAAMVSAHKGNLRATMTYDVATSDAPGRK